MSGGNVTEKNTCKVLGDHSGQNSYLINFYFFYNHSIKKVVKCGVQIWR